MPYELGIPQQTSFVLTARERARYSILVVDSEAISRNTLRQALVSSGFSKIFDASNHVIALEKMEDRDFSHTIFEAKNSVIKSKDFLQQALSRKPNLVAIPSSYQPTVDDVFQLLVMGARGYLVKPFTTGAVDQTMIMATKGEAISDSIIQTTDRNEAISSLIITALDKLAIVMRQARDFETAKLEIPKRLQIFRQAVDIGKTFRKGSEEELQKAIVDYCMRRSEVSISRLSRFKDRFHTRKASTVVKKFKLGEEPE